MNKILSILIIAVVCFFIGYFVGNNEIEQLSTADTLIVKDTVFVSEDKIIIKYIEVDAIIDTIVITDTIGISDTTKYARVRNLKIDNYNLDIDYNYKLKQFNINFKKLYDIITVRTETIYKEPSKKKVRFGLNSALFTKHKEYQIASFLTIEFPKLIENFQIGIGASSDKSLGISIAYQF